MYEEELIVIEDDQEEELVVMEEAEEFVYPDLQEKEVTPSGEIQEITADNGVYGLSKVTVDRVNLQDKSVTPSSSEQIVTADSNFAGLSKVIVEPIPEVDLYDPFDVKAVLENDEEDYPYKVIVLLPDTDRISYSIDNIGIVGYKSSDGQSEFYESSVSAKTWKPDSTKSVPNKLGMKMMWIILYCDENQSSGIGNTSCFHNYFKAVYSKMEINSLFNSYNQYNIKEIEFINGGCYIGTTNNINSYFPFEKFLQNNAYYPNFTSLRLQYAYNLQEIGDFDFTGVNLYSSSYAGQACYNLRKIGKVSNIDMAFNFSKALLLPLESLINLLNGLVYLDSTTKTLIIGPVNKSKLESTDEGQQALALATSKGWNVA